MSAKLPQPLSGPAPKEVPLKTPPLVRVLAQVRFPPILSIHNPDFVAKFQDKVRVAYPILEKQQVQQLVFAAPANAPQIEADVIWRFYDKERKWRVSLSTGFVALEAMSYLSRKDFLERLEAILDATEEIFAPVEASRVGLRYVDRIVATDAIPQPETLIKASSLGIVSTELGPLSDHIFSEILLPTEEGAKINTKWGKLPANASIDADLEPINQTSWILDFDMFTDTPKNFSSKEIVSQAKLFSERIYSVFRWMVTDDFLKAYGGEA